MKRFPSTSTLTPEHFERQVRLWLESVAGPLKEFRSRHLDTIAGIDGDYTIDVTARFQALGGATFLVLIECKKHKNAIKREVVQVLREKQLSVGAQKAIVVATADFQAGAIEYASTHGIALVQIVSGLARYIQGNASQSAPPAPEADADDFIGLFYGPNPSGKLFYPQLLSSTFTWELAGYLGVEKPIRVL